MKKTLIIASFVGVAGFLFNSFTTKEKTNYTKTTLDEPAPKKLNPLWEDYKSWYHITKGNPNTGDPTGFLDGKHKGEDAYREIYINKIGEPIHKKSGNNTYPAGTVVVKEQYKNKKKWESGKGVALTVMVKLEKGEAPEYNDWKYYMNNSSGNIIMNWQKFCSSCHIYAQAKDFLFMNSDQMKLEK